METQTRRWRLVIILLLVISVLSLGIITWLERQPLGILRELHSSWGTASAQEGDEPAQQTPAIVSALSVLFTLSGGGTLALYLFPVRIRRLHRTLSTSLKGLLRLSGLGFLGMLVAVIIGIGAAFSWVFPVMLFLGALLILSSYLGMIAMAYTLGQGLLQRAGWPHLSPVYALLLGVFVLFPFAELPYVGFIFKILFASLGTGAVIATRFGSGQLWTLEPLLEENLS